MLAFAMSAALIGSGAPATYPEWTPIQTSEHGDVYLRAGPGEDRFRTAWLLVDASETSAVTMGGRSAITQIAIDCREDRVAVSVIAVYAETGGQGEVQASRLSPLAWTEARAGSGFDMARQRVCAGQDLTLYDNPPPGIPESPTVTIKPLID